MDWDNRIHKERPDSDETWMRWAACRGVTDPDFFFNGTKGQDANTNAQRCKAICRDCPVRRRCLDYALANGEKFGIWGGYTSTELKKLRSQRRSA